MKIINKKRKERRKYVSLCRKKNKATKCNKKSILLLSIIAITSVFSYFLFFSSFFDIKNIQINGNNKIKNEEILSLVEQSRKENPIGISRENFFFTKTDEIESLFLENFTQLESVNVERKIPNKLVIYIEEKDPALIWCRNKCFFVNMEGVAFLEADEQKLLEENQSFIKIIENTQKDDIFYSQEEENADDTEETEQETEYSEETAELPEIAINQQISDKNFIQTAIDINRRISYNSKLQIKFYKTRGTATRELVAFSDKNTRIYFDTTKDIEAQTENLGYFLDSGITQSEIDSLEYIYLKNQDRIFYK